MSARENYCHLDNIRPKISAAKKCTPVWVQVLLKLIILTFNKMFIFSLYTAPALFHTCTSSWNATLNMPLRKCCCLSTILLKDQSKVFFVCVWITVDPAAWVICTALFPFPSEHLLSKAEFDHWFTELLLLADKHKSVSFQWSYPKTGNKLHVILFSFSLDGKESSNMDKKIPLSFNLIKIYPG